MRGENPVVWAEWACLVTRGALAVTLPWRITTTRTLTSSAALSALLLLAATVSVWSVSRITERVFDHGVFWIASCTRRGRAVAVPDDWVVMFTPAFRRTGPEDAVVAVVGTAERASAWSSRGNGSRPLGRCTRMCSPLRADRLVGRTLRLRT